MKQYKKLERVIERYNRGLKSEENSFLLIPILIELAKNQKTILYSELQDFFIDNSLSIKQFSPNGFYGRTLGIMQDIISDIDSNAPELNSIVINTKGTQGDGFFLYNGFKKNKLRKMTNEERMAYTNECNRKTFKYNFTKTYQKLKKILINKGESSILKTLIDAEKTINVPTSNSYKIAYDSIRNTYKEIIENFEGEQIERKTLSYSRNRKNIILCKKRDEYTCKACNFFLDKKIVECHHLEPLHISKKITISTDKLITLCPTCHKIAHLLIQNGLEEYQNKDVLIKEIQVIKNAK